MTESKEQKKNGRDSIEMGRFHSLPPLHQGASGPRVRVGRKTRFPPQLGQTEFMASVQAWQNVHSYEQMKATSVIPVRASHFSQCDFIFSMALASSDT
jgi:hypothetical protein